MSSELVRAEGFANSLVNAQTDTYCSMKMDTPQDKARFYNATTNPEYRTSDFINKFITIRDIICEPVVVKSRDGGQMVAPRVILIDNDGHSYASTSTGIYSAIRRMITVFGEPTWEGGITVEVKQLKKGENNILTLEIGEF